MSRRKANRGLKYYAADSHPNPAPRHGYIHRGFLIMQTGERVAACGRKPYGTSRWLWSGAKPDCPNCQNLHS